MLCASPVTMTGFVNNVYGTYNMTTVSAPQASCASNQFALMTATELTDAIKAGGSTNDFASLGITAPEVAAVYAWGLGLIISTYLVGYVVGIAKGLIAKL